MLFVAITKLPCWWTFMLMFGLLLIILICTQRNGLALTTTTERNSHSRTTLSSIFSGYEHLEDTADIHEPCHDTADIHAGQHFLFTNRTSTGQAKITFALIATPQLTTIEA